MSRYYLIIFLLSLLNITSAQTVNLFPDHLNVKPFTANNLEARAGFFFFTNKSALQLNAGLSQDFVHIYQTDKAISFGADIFTYTRLRSTDNFKFPVETIDYLFGVNFTARQKFNSLFDEAGFRLRLSHISTHLVDGRLIDSTTWMDNQHPFVYSREFLELIPYIKINSLRLYVGYTHLLHSIPVFKKDLYQAGFDFYPDFNLAVVPFVAYDVKIENRTGSYRANHSASIGVKFGTYNGKGLSVSFNYYNGLSLQGQYFDKKEDYLSLGINLEL